MSFSPDRSARGNRQRRDLADNLRWYRKRHHWALGRSKCLEEPDHRGIDLCRTLLLGPVTTPWQHELPAKLRDCARQVRQRLFHPGKFHHQILVAGNIEGWQRYLRTA